MGLDSQGNSEVEKRWNGDGLTPLTHGHTQAMTMTMAKTMTKTLTNYREFKIMVSRAVLHSFGVNRSGDLRSNPSI